MNDAEPYGRSRRAARARPFRRRRGSGAGGSLGADGSGDSSGSDSVGRSERGTIEQRRPQSDAGLRGKGDRMGDEDERVRNLVERGKATRFGAKRGNGRPPKQPVVDAAIDPRAAGAAPGAEPREPDAAPQSGRPVGAGTGSATGASSRTSLDLSSLAAFVVGCHELAATRPGHEFWKLSPTDEKGLTKAIGDVLRHYSIPVTQKAIDHFALVVFLWRIETPRFVMERAVNARDAAPPAAATGLGDGATIFKFTPPGFTGSAPVVPDIPVTG